MTGYAPIAISVYKRFDHLRLTISALKKNSLAKDSELYVFSDAPRSGDEKDVAAVREYVRTITGFKRIIVNERKTNSFVENNVGAMETLANKFGKFIFLEEDVVTAPGFLKYINDALTFYKDDDRILSISGYSRPLNICKYKKQVYFLRRFNAWGFGMWKHTFELIKPVNENEYCNLLADKRYLKGFLEYGEDMLCMLKREVLGEIDAFDVKAMYWQYIYGLYTVYPRYSLTQNIGHDGTGVHCGMTNKFDTVLWDKTGGFVFESDVEVDSEIKKLNKKFRKIDRSLNWYDLIRKIVRYSGLRKLKRLVVGS